MVERIELSAGFSVERLAPVSTVSAAQGQGSPGASEKEKDEEREREKEGRGLGSRPHPKLEATDFSELSGSSADERSQDDEREWRQHRLDSLG